MTGEKAPKTVPPELEDATRELQELAYAISHDVRAPLRVIDGFSEALLDEHRQTLPPSALDYLQTIRSAVVRMEQLFDGVQELSRLSQTPLRRERVDVTAVAESIAARLAGTDPSREVIISIEPGLVAHADSALLGLALTQLLENAWKFTRKRSDAAISVGRHGTNGLFVRDNGVGLDVAAARHLFGPFQRFHPVAEFEGLGIGLAMVRRIVHRHDGHVRVEAVPGQGMTVYMELQ